MPTKRRTNKGGAFDWTNPIGAKNPFYKDGIRIKGTGVKKTNPWIKFLMAFRKKHPNLSVGDAAKQASRLYKK